MAVLEFESGALGLWVGTSAARGEGFGKQAIYGEEGSLCWDSGLKSAEREMSLAELVQAHSDALSDEQRQQLFPMGLTDGMAIELHQFIEAVLGRGSVETDGLEGYKAEAIALALFEADRLGRKVSMEEVEKLEVEQYQAEINRALGIA